MNTMIWFTSDLHLGHNNIIEYCDRIDTSTSAMNERIINNWNKVVKRGDTVYVLGDFGFIRKKEDVEAILRRLNGQKHLILGNHDHDAVRKASGWASVSPLKDIRVKYIDKNGITRYQEVTLCHYAMKVWKHSGHGSWQLYGHSHGTLPDDPNSFQMDVGVDANNFTPISFYQVKEIMSKKYYQPVDYHGYAGVSTIPEHLELKRRTTYDKITICNRYYTKEDPWEKHWDNLFQEK